MRNFKKILKAVLLFAVCLLLFYTYMRYRDNLLYNKEVGEAKEFLKATITHDVPPPDWIKKCAYKPSNEMFYFFKIWFMLEGINEKQIDRSYLNRPVYKKNENEISFDLNYGKNLPVIQCNLKEFNKGYIILAMFPLNNCLFNPDFNGDGLIDVEDLKLAREKKVKMICEADYIPNFLLFEVKNKCLKVNSRFLDFARNDKVG